MLNTKKNMNIILEEIRHKQQRMHCNIDALKTESNQISETGASKYGLNVAIEVVLKQFDSFIKQKPIIAVGIAVALGMVASKTSTISTPASKSIENIKDEIIDVYKHEIKKIIKQAISQINNHFQVKS